MGAALSRSTDPNCLYVRPSNRDACCEPRRLDLSTPPELQGLISDQEWARAAQAINGLYELHDHITKLRILGTAAAVIFVVLAIAVSVWFAIVAICLVFAVPLAVWCHNDAARRETQRVQQQLNSEIFGGALLRTIVTYGRTTTKTRVVLYEVCIDLTRLRAARSAMPQAFEAPYATSAGFGGVAAVAEAVPVVSAAHVPAVLSSQTGPAVLQLVIPDGAAPGSVLNVSLSDGRTIAVTVPADGKPGQTLQVQVPSV